MPREVKLYSPFFQNIYNLIAVIDLVTECVSRVMDKKILMSCSDDFLFFNICNSQCVLYPREGLASYASSTAVVAVYALSFGGLIEAASKMSFGNGIGFEIKYNKN